MVLSIIGMTLLCETIALLYMACRNEWVYDQRIKLTHSDFETYKRLPSYGEMVDGHGFWHWDIKYYLRDKEEK